MYGNAALNDAQWSTGAQLLINAVDRADTRPLWVSIWGGANTLAQALWRVRNTRNSAQVDAFCAKLRVYAIEDQDETCAWIVQNFPQVFIIFRYFSFLSSPFPSFPPSSPMIQNEKH